MLLRRLQQSIASSNECFFDGSAGQARASWVPEDDALQLASRTTGNKKMMESVQRDGKH
jgi:hypothetical protein